MQELGGLSGGTAPEELGYGAQSPIPQGSPPLRVPKDGAPESQRFAGGLLIGEGTNRVLYGVSPLGYLICTAPCLDFGGASGSIRSSQSGATVIRWGHNTIAPGFFMDWDQEGADTVNDVGNLAPVGKLAYVTSDLGGPHAGTSIETGSAGVWFGDLFQPPTLAPENQVRILRGQLTNPTVGPTDLWYIHGEGSRTIPRGQSRDLWTAVVAGADLNEMLANAAAAEAEIAARQLAGTAVVDCGMGAAQALVPLKTLPGATTPAKANPAGRL